MKKIAVMLLAALMLFAFVACDNEPQKSDAGQKLYDMFDGADGFSDNIAITSDGSGLLLKMVKDENELTINGPVAYFDESKLLAVETIRQQRFHLRLMLLLWLKMIIRSSQLAIATIRKPGLERGFLG